MVGISTGPGALLSSAAGGLIFGVAGYYGSDWIADNIHDSHQKPDNEKQ